MNSAVLEMRGIVKRFPGVLALNSVDLEVGHGEILALIGENGAGKSTLMNVLGGLCEPDDGTIRIDGEIVKIRSVPDAMSLGIGFIHQELHLLDNLDIAGNVFLGREPIRAGWLRLIQRNEIHARTEVYLKRLGSNLAASTPVSELSVAQRQIVEIAKALSLNARILIMDEPTSSLTLIETRRLRKTVKDLSSQGVSIVYISHRLAEIPDFADRVIVLRDGARVGTLTQAEIGHDSMVRLMVGRDLAHFYPDRSAGGKRGYFTVFNLRTARYPDCRVSLEVGSGEILGLAGLVGAGRSEVAQAIFGVEPALEGRFSLDGKDIEIQSSRDAIKHGIYLVPEDRRGCGLILEMGIRENISLPSLLRHASMGLIRSEAERKLAADQCKALKVKAPSLEERALNLSGGNQQKLVLAKWLALKPRVLVFDEPTRGIDVGAKADIYDLMRKLAENGVAIVMISSDMEEILGISDRVAVMHEGSISGVIERDECSEEGIMQLAVGRRPAIKTSDE